MYTSDKYNKLKQKYGSYSSWAIWNDKEEGDLSVIEQNINVLNSNYVLLGLNIARPLANDPWLNFHGGSKHDRKLRYACNHTVLRGSYITDIFKGIAESKSTRFEELVTNQIIEENVKFFHEEMNDIELTKDSQFIILGTPKSILAQYFNNHFRQIYKNKVVFHYHYSYYGITDQKWVNGLWEKLYGDNTD